MARSSENHLKRARERLNALHESIDALEKATQDLRGQVVAAERSLEQRVREYVEAKTAEAIEKLKE